MNSERLPGLVPRNNGVRNDGTDVSPCTEGVRRGPGLAVRNLVKRFGSVTAVDDVSFTVPGGSFLGLLGPSGSGKTTVLRLLGGFESPDRGVIEIGGADVSQLPPYRRDIGVVFQHYALFPHMTVAENLEFPLRQRGFGRSTRDARVAEILDTVGLSGYGDRNPAGLSGGEQQRVALGRALAFGPRVLVMDEPLAALDKRLRERLQHEIRTLQRRLGITTVYVTHDQTEAFVMSDLVAVMNAGRIEQMDTPQALYDAPRTEFVAQFVGDSNLFRGETMGGGPDEHAVSLPDGTVLHCPASSRRSGPVTLLVRPEKISIRASDATPHDNTLCGRIVDAVFLGETLDYRISAGGNEVIVRQQNRPGTTVSRPGEEVTLSWAVNDTVVL